MSLARPTPRPELATAVHRMVSADGAVRAAAALGVAREAAVRIAAGLPVRRGTLLLAEQALVRLACGGRTVP
jgi:hypothetical protein